MGIAHEINNLLAIISGNLELIKENQIEGADLVYLHGRIEAAAHRISRIVKGLKKISRSSDSLIYSHRVFSNIVSEAVHLANGMMEKELITLKFDLSTDAEIECDEVEIEQVVLNLIGNAIDAIKNLTDKWIKIEVFTETGSNVLRITDSGPGIPEAIRIKLFDPFFTTKEIDCGTGLEVSISKGILDEHGATIRVDTSSANTCFEIRFPVVEKLAAGD